MKPSKIRAIFALTLVLAMLTLGVRSFAASSPAKVSLDLKFAELAEVFRVLAQVGGSNIVVSPAVSGKITVKLTNVPVEEALDIICSVSDLEYIYMNGTIMVGPKGTVSKLMDKAVVEKVELLNISATDAATKLSFAIPGIAAQPDDKSGTLLIRGNQSDIALAKAFLAKVDAPLPLTKMTISEEEVIDIIQLSNAEAKGVYDAVSKLLKASLAVDTRLNAILAGGKLTDVKAARSIIEKLDIVKKTEVSTQPVEIRVIQLTNAAATDVKAVASLIIPADRIQSEAKSNTLIIKATPEEHARVSDLVKNIEAATPKTAAVAEVREKLEVVTLLYAKATDVAEALTVVLPANKIAIDERTNKIVMLVDAASGTEAMALIKELDVKIADITVASIAAPILRLGYYSPVHAKAQDIEAVVKLVASGAKLQVIESNNSLVAYGTDADHALIAEALKKLDEEALSVKNAAVKQPALTMEVIELKHAKAADVQKALASVLPAENVTIDERTNKVLLKITPDEKRMAMEIIGAIDVKVDQPTVVTVAPSLEVINLKYANAAAVKKVLDGVLGADKVNIDERTNKVIVLGIPDERALAAQIIKNLDIEIASSTPKAAVSSLEVFQLTYAQAADVQKALAAVVSPSGISIDERSNKVIILGTPDERSLASQIIQNMDIEIASLTLKPIVSSFEAIQLKYAKAADVQKALSAIMVPANVSIDERTNKLLLKVTPEEKQLAMAIINELDVRIDEKVAQVEVENLEIVELKFAKAADVRPALEAALGQSKVNIDERSNKVLMIVTPSKKQLAMSIISAIDVPIAVAVVQTVEPMLEMIQLKFAVASEVKKVLDGVLGAANVNIDERTNKLLLKVTPEEKRLAMAVINELDIRVDMATSPVEVENLEVVELKFAKAADVRPALEAALGQSKVSIDERSNKVLMIVTAAKKQLAMSIISAIDVPIAVAAVQTVEPTLEMVQLKYAIAADVKRVLDGVLGAANVNIDERTNKLLLKVTPEEKRSAMAVINELDIRVDMATTPVEVESLEVVELKFAKAADAKPALDAALGQGKVSVDDRSNKVLMIVTPAKKQLAMSIIGAIDVPVAATAVANVEPKLEMLQLKYAIAADVKRVLDGVLGASNVNIDERTNKVIVMVTPAGKAVALDIVGNLDIEVAPKVQPVIELSTGVETLQIVQLKYAPAIEVGKALEAVISEAKVNVDARTNKIIMNVTDEEYSQARAIIAALDIRLEGEVAATSETVQMGFFKLYNVKPSDIEASVKVVAGAAKVQAADQTASITAYGTSMELKMIESLIAKLDVAPSERGVVAAAVRETLEVIQLTNANAADVRASLSVLLPESKISINERTNKVMMIVTPELKSQAMAIISALDVPVAQTAVLLSDPVRLGFFQLKYASAKDMEAPVKLVASAAKVQVAERTNSMIVYGTESELALIEEVISKLDIDIKSPEEASAALAEYKTYKLNNASPTEISSALTILLPASSMLPDDRSGTLIIKAVPELQKLAADVIATLDVKSVTQVSVDADASVTRVYKLNHAEPADLKAALGEVTTGKVSIDTRTASLIITAKASEQAQLVEIIDQLDQELAQVFFEASLYELSGDATQRLGIDWTINKLVFGYNTLSQLATVSLDFDNKIAALATEGKAKLISKQHTYTVDGKAGRMLIGDRIPVIVQNVEQGQVVNTVEYINAGIELTILAKVSYDGSITAEVKPIISSIIGWTPQNYPQIRTRELETIVTVKNGESAIIGGLFSQEEIETINKVPILGDIPLIKELFTKRGTDTKDQEIIIVITAWIIKPGQTTGIKDGIVEIKGPVL